MSLGRAGARWLALAVVLVGALSVLACARTPARPVAHVESGWLRGAVEGRAAVFRGVPYAAAPVGALRWAPPQPPARWSGLREAARFGPACPQKPEDAPPRTAQSEDCLFLNVWRPAGAVVRAPVMVWIHGGANAFGAASQSLYDGAAFARDGIVLVSINYRLGSLGWFAHPALTRAAGPRAPLADYGLMDQVAALRWVRRNIAGFGGDPRQVTIAGESAGAQAVLMLMSLPQARGLFARAIVQSAPGWAPLPDLATAQAAGEALARRAGAAPDADAAALRRLPLPALIAAQAQTAVPVRDGRLVAETPAAAFAQGRAAAVPLLIGSNTGEDSLLGRADPAPGLAGLPPAQVEALRRAYGLQPAQDAALGRFLFRDRQFGAPARWFAAEAARRAPTWLYRFGYVPLSGRLDGHRAAHGAELPYIFGSLGRTPGRLNLETPLEGAETRTMHGCWAAFVKTGAPACPGGPACPPYDPRNGWLMTLGDISSFEPDSLGGVLDIIDRIDAPSGRTPAGSAGR